MKALYPSAILKQLTMSNDDIQRFERIYTMLEFIVKNQDALNRQNLEMPSRPRLKDTVIAVPISGERLAFRQNVRQIMAIVQDLPGRPASYCLKLMDGTRSLEEIVTLMLEHDARLTGETLNTFLQGLHEIGVLEEQSISLPANLTDDDLKRYSRNIHCWSMLTSPELPSKYAIQSLIRQKHVMILGVGGIGSNCALGLAMLGIGSLTLLDFDVVELQNLNRQILYDTPSIGRPKVEVACERLRQVNPSVHVTALNERLHSTQQIQELIQVYHPDILVLGADHPVSAVDRWVNQACFSAGIPYITGAVYGLGGLVRSSVPGKTGCYECNRLRARDTSADDYEIMLYREEHDLLYATSALGFGAEIVASFIGYDITHYFLGQPMASAGAQFSIDFFNMSIAREPRPSHPECPVCGPLLGK